MVRNPLIDMSFMRACRNEITEHKCNQMLKAADTNIEKLSVVLICLGSVVKEGF
jgi:hypothetical protein